MAGLHVFPEPLEVGQVALELELAAVHPRGADDEPEALGELELVEDVAHGAALLLVLDLAGDAHAVHLGHHHQEASGDGEVAGEGGALGSHALLEHLDDHLVAEPEALLDGGALAPGRLAPDALGGVVVLAGEVAGVDIGDVEEAVVLDAEIDERRLDGGLDVGDDADVDVADAADAGGPLGVELLEAAVLDYGDPALFAGDVVDDHLLLTHFKPSWGRCRVPQVDRRFGRSTCAYRQGAQAQVAASKQAATCGTLCDRICTADPCVGPAAACCAD